MLRSVRVLLFAVLCAILISSAWAVCPQGDLDDNCKVDFGDVKFLAGRWLDPAGSEADIVGSDGVNSRDFAILAANWLEVGDAPGELVIWITPSIVVADGAQWRVVEGDWQDSGEPLPASRHAEFEAVKAQFDLLLAGRSANVAAADRDP